MALIFLGLALLGIIILVFVKQKKRKTGEVKEPNYQIFFAIGICFVGAGVTLTATINPGFIGITALGLIYMIIGLKNKDKWSKSKKET